MEKAGKFQGSHGKGRRKEKSRKQVSDTPAKLVDKSKNVDKMSTKSKNKTIQQRINIKTYREINSIKEKYNRRSFNDTLQLLLFCYDFLDAVAVKYGLSDIKESTEFIKKHLPKSHADLIHESVRELIKVVGVNGPDAEVLTDHFLKTLILVKLQKKRASEVLRPILAIRGDK